MFRHLITKSIPSEQEIRKMIRKGYEWLHDNMFEPGNDLNDIMQRLPLVVVLPNDARKERKVRFMHIFYTDDSPRFLQISCGIFPENHAGAIVMDLDPEEPPPEEAAPFPCPLSEMVPEAVECLRCLCRTPGRGKAPPKRSFLLLLASVSNPNALVELHLQYVSGGGAPLMDESRLEQIVELFAEKRETMRREIVMAGFKIRHLIKETAAECAMRLDGAAEACMYRAMMEEWKIRGK